MELLLLWVMFYGVTKGIEYAADYSRHDAKIAASQAWRKKAGKRPVTRSARLGWFAGRTASAGWHGARHGAAGLRNGWRAGWPAGKQIAHERHERRGTVTTPDGATVTPIRDTTPTPEAAERPAGIPLVIPSRNSVYGSSALADPTAMVDVGSVADAEHPEITIYHNDGTWTRHTTADLDEFAAWRAEASRQANAYEIRDYDIYPDTDRPDGLATVTPITEGASMSIATATGGEVTTYGTLIAELEAIEKEAVGDLEDASADQQRAKENAARFETMQASLAALKLDDKTLGEIAALGQAATAKLQAAEARASAAEQAAALAEAARKGVQERHAAIQEHANVLAERDFYQG